MTDSTPIETDCQGVAARLREAKGEGFLLVDCREHDEHALARIQGARLLPMSELAARVEELAEHREQIVVIHCHHGGRSLKVARWLREQGFPHAQSMAGGIDQWSQTIDPSVPRY